MRQLQVVGLADDASSVILEDPVRHERFIIACDERLRAAARADVRRLGQMDIETTSPLRPRDIQARVRAGETPEQVASTAGVSASQVERFAYPVLLERSRVAELATRAHPLRGDRPDPRTLGEIASETFLARGQEYDDAVWDAWKGDDGRWVVALAWRTGRSDNMAHWTFRPGPSGGTLAALDEAAHEMTGAALPSGPRRADGRPGRGGPAGGHPAPELPLDAFIQAGDDPAETAAKGAATEGPAPEPVEPEQAVPDALVANGEDLPSPPTGAVSTKSGGNTVNPSPPRARTPRGGGGPGARERSRGARPTVPSWEDVLLGVRSPKG